MMGRRARTVRWRGLMARLARLARQRMKCTVGKARPGALWRTRRMRVRRWRGIRPLDSAVKAPAFACRRALVGLEDLCGLLGRLGGRRAGRRGLVEGLCRLRSAGVLGDSLLARGLVTAGSLQAMR